MSRADEIINRFELRRNCTVKGVEGQKMDETCIQQFITSDPSGNGKYLEWMLYQAGGGKERLDKSTSQWEKGDHGEPPVRETLREQFVKDCQTGYKDDKGEPVQPVTKEVAEAQWAEAEPRLRRQHVYGDEDYAITGFGFYRTWPGHNDLYAQIVQTVKRFHKYRQALQVQSKSIDLNLKEYPNLRDLMEALQDLTLVELKNDLVFDKVWDDDHLLVIAPMNIGASIKFGIPKWCTACESMMKSALAGQGPNRWKEYAKDSALYYCKFKVKDSRDYHPWHAVAIQVNHTDKTIRNAKFWNAEDTSHDQQTTVQSVSSKVGTQFGLSFQKALGAIEDHFRKYPRQRVILEAIVSS
jgi:hypothetical protein